ncbi:hypothetical protein EV421DRAFT_1729611 [Armillaria borealis]|uniref:Uncharacterized protein n=1 Tax=Armillaria borealis TaxID=47425 RepID=A0AA39K6N3_9AGAR|nr:hypothetical protein EV421DRAFT_1729611 [Armillaria borealis]
MAASGLSQAEVVPGNSSPRDNLLADIDNDGGAYKGSGRDLVDRLDLGKEVGRGIDMGACVCAEKEGLDAVAVFWDGCMGRTGIGWVTGIEGYVEWIEWVAEVDALDDERLDPGNSHMMAVKNGSTNNTPSFNFDTNSTLFSSLNFGGNSFLVSAVDSISMTRKSRLTDQPVTQAGFPCGLFKLAYQCHPSLLYCLVFQERNPLLTTAVRYVDANKHKRRPKYFRPFLSLSWTLTCPVNPKFGPSHPWMLVKPDFYYGPFFPAWQPVPPTTTEAHTIHSPVLATALTKLYVELLPRIRKCQSDIPRIRTAMSTDPLSTLKWEGFDIMIQCEDFITDCWYEPVKLVFGDKAPPRPPRHHRSVKRAPKYWKLVDEAAFTLGRYVKLIDDRPSADGMGDYLHGNNGEYHKLRTEIAYCIENTALGYITKPLGKYVIPFIDHWMGEGENDCDSSSGKISASTSSGSTSSSGAEPDNPARPKPFFHLVVVVQSSHRLQIIPGSTTLEPSSSPHGMAQISASHGRASFRSGINNMRDNVQKFAKGRGKEHGGPTSVYLDLSLYPVRIHAEDVVLILAVDSLLVEVKT